MGSWNQWDYGICDDCYILLLFGERVRHHPNANRLSVHSSLFQCYTKQRRYLDHDGHIDCQHHVGVYQYRGYCISPDMVFCSRQGTSLLLFHWICKFSPVTSERNLLSANLRRLKGQARVEHSPEFGPHHVLNHNPFVSDQHRIHGSIQRHWLSRSLCDPRNLHHFLHRAHSPPPSQRAIAITTMDSRPLRNLHQYRSRALPTCCLGVCVLPARDPSYSADHELECTHVWLDDVVCCCLLHAYWKEYIYGACGIGQAEYVKFSVEDSTWRIP